MRSVSSSARARIFTACSSEANRAWMSARTRSEPSTSTTEPGWNASVKARSTRSGSRRTPNGAAASCRSRPSSTRPPGTLPALVISAATAARRHGVDRVSGVLGSVPSPLVITAREMPAVASSSPSRPGSAPKSSSSLAVTVSAIGMYTSPWPAAMPVRVVNTTPARSRPKASSTPKPWLPVEPLATARAPAPMVTYPLGSGVGRSTPLVTIAPIDDEANSLSRLGVDACSKSAHSVLGSDTISTRPCFGVAAPAGPTHAAERDEYDDRDRKRARRGPRSQPPAAHDVADSAGVGSGRGVALGP